MSAIDWSRRCTSHYVLFVSNVAVFGTRSFKWIKLQQHAANRILDSTSFLSSNALVVPNVFTRRRLSL